MILVVLFAYQLTYVFIIMFQIYVLQIMNAKTFLMTLKINLVTFSSFLLPMALLKVVSNQIKSAKQTCFITFHHLILFHQHNLYFLNLNGSQIHLKIY